MTQPVAPSVTSSLESIAHQASAITKEREGIDRAELDLTARIEKLAISIQLYNRQRLDPIIEMLVNKELAYFAENRWNEGLLVPESELRFRTESGVEEVWHGSEYYERKETEAYCRTYFEHSKTYRPGCSNSHKGVTVRQRWVSDFRDRFACKCNKDLPGWLLVALEKKLLPPEPLECITSTIDARYEDKERLTEGVLSVRYVETPLRVYFRVSKNFRDHESRRH